VLHISCKARFPRFCAIPVIHPSLRHEIESPTLLRLKTS